MSDRVRGGLAVGALIMALLLVPQATMADDGGRRGHRGWQPFVVTICEDGQTKSVRLIRAIKKVLFRQATWGECSGGGGGGGGAPPAEPPPTGGGGGTGL